MGLDLIGSIGLRAGRAFYFPYGNDLTVALASCSWDSLSVKNGGQFRWCGVCNQILPAFCKLSNNFPKLSFIYADIDECPETTQHIRYTPTFHFYRDGERVDEMFGAGEERLHDRLWLHS
ncbi:Thioredoxin-like 3-3 [Citrus sinensis]|uniref:Thioredoxin-like 3-3 n=1 Tax=Citrus sinensis TaxID=2711 RepID=A0ACB8NBV7_CITSI|nr:Thioredoxin-like 3-3 [Citrus sinensis]KAH9795064.1 Thioredoxin-like 3-3 [Citrus sinensis]